MKKFYSAVIIGLMLIGCKKEPEATNATALPVASQPKAVIKTHSATSKVTTLPAVDPNESLQMEARQVVEKAFNDWQGFGDVTGFQDLTGDFINRRTLLDYKIAGFKVSESSKTGEKWHGNYYGNVNLHFQTPEGKSFTKQYFVIIKRKDQKWILSVIGQ